MSTSDTQNLIRSEAELQLDEARRKKADRTKHLGDLIQLPGIGLDISVQNGYAWVAENTAVARKIDLETGKTVQLYKGHKAPVTCLAFCSSKTGGTDEDILITGSWDRTIKLWDTRTKATISSTDAHDDFVKGLFVLPGSPLLISGSSDKIVRFWDLSSPRSTNELTPCGSLSAAHTRPVECLQGYTVSFTSAVLFTGDTMGSIKVWELSFADNRWTALMIRSINCHRTRINQMLFGNAQLWTASSDETVVVTPFPPTDEDVKPSVPLSHPKAVRAILPLALTPLEEPIVITGAGDVITVFDVSDPSSPQTIRTVDAHWHDVTALKLWVRQSRGDDGITSQEPWVVSASLDGTIRKWRLADLLNPGPVAALEPLPPLPEIADDNFKLSEDEERELAELMDSD